MTQCIRPSSDVTTKGQQLAAIGSFCWWKLQWEELKIPGMQISCVVIEFKLSEYTYITYIFSSTYLSTCTFGKNIPLIHKMCMIKCTIHAVVAPRGAWGGIFPLLEALPPLALLRREKWQKSAIFVILKNFCPLRYAFCPLDAPPQKFSGAATTYMIEWCTLILCTLCEWVQHEVYL